MNASQILRALGPLDELTVGRILAIDPTPDEIDLALAWLVADDDYDPLRTAPSDRVEQILALARPAWEAWEVAQAEEAAP